MRYLMKFGGTSVADAQCIRRVVDILEQHHAAGDEVAVVVSAQRGVTDLLIEVASALPTANDDKAIKPMIEALRRRHMTTLEEAAPDYIAEVAAGSKSGSSIWRTFFTPSIICGNSLPAQGIMSYHLGNGFLLLLSEPRSGNEVSPQP